MDHDNISSRKPCIFCFSVLFSPDSPAGSGGAVRPIVRTIEGNLKRWSTVIPYLSSESVRVGL